MPECKKLFILAVGVLDKLNPEDKSPVNAIRYALDEWVATATDMDIEHGFVDIPDGEGPVFTLVCRGVEG